MVWWTDALTSGWAIAKDLLKDLGPVLFLPVAMFVLFAVGNFVKGMSN